MLDAELLKKTSSTNPQKHGDIRKCPSCGAIYEAGSVKCRQCGYVFVGVKANSSAKLLFDKLNDLDNKYRDKKGGSYFLATMGLSKPIEAKMDTERGNVIKNFPVPTTKEDLLEFIPIMEERWKGTKSVSDTTGRFLLDKEKMAYRSKYLECIQKAQMMFGNDKDFLYIFERYNKKNWAMDGIINKLRLSKSAYIAIFTVLFFAFSYIGESFSDNDKEKERIEIRNQIDNEYERISKMIDSMETPNNTNYDQSKRDILTLSWNEIMIKDGFREEKYYQIEKKQQFEEKKRTYILLLNSVYKKKYRKDDEDFGNYLDNN